MFMCKKCIGRTYAKECFPEKFYVLHQSALHVQRNLNVYYLYIVHYLSLYSIDNMCCFNLCHTYNTHSINVYYSYIVHDLSLYHTDNVYYSYIVHDLSLYHTDNVQIMSCFHMKMIFPYTETRT